MIKTTIKNKIKILISKFTNFQTKGEEKVKVSKFPEKNIHRKTLINRKRKKEKQHLLTLQNTVPRNQTVVLQKELSLEVIECLGLQKNNR